MYLAGYPRICPTPKHGGMIRAGISSQIEEEYTEVYLFGYSSAHLQQKNSLDNYSIIFSKEQIWCPAVNLFLSRGPSKISIRN